jgi:hypothetical protein
VAAGQDCDLVVLNVGHHRGVVAVVLVNPKQTAEIINDEFAGAEAG